MGWAAVANSKADRQGGNMKRWRELSRQERPAWLFERAVDLYMVVSAVFFTAALYMTLWVTPPRWLW